MKKVFIYIILCALTIAVTNCVRSGNASSDSLQDTAAVANLYNQAADSTENVNSNPSIEEISPNEINLQWYSDSLKERLEQAWAAADTTNRDYDEATFNVLPLIFSDPKDRKNFTKEWFASYSTYVLYCRNTEGISEGIYGYFFSALSLHDDLLGKIRQWLKDLTPELQKEVVRKIFDNVRWEIYLSDSYDANHDLIYETIAEKWPALLEMCEEYDIDAKSIILE